MTSLISLNENPDLEPDLTLTTQTVAYLEVPVHEAQRLKSGTSGYVSVVLEPSCCKKRQKSPNQETGLVNREPLEVLNDIKWILNNQGGHSCSSRTNLV